MNANILAVGDRFRFTCRQQRQPDSVTNSSFNNPATRSPTIHTLILIPSSLKQHSGFVQPTIKDVLFSALHLAWHILGSAPEALETHFFP